MYDAIVVGARVAGASTAMLLARKGYRVLMVDRATFPSDTLSTHQLQIPGSILLKKWGLLDRVLATSPGAAHHVHFDSDGIVLDGEYPTVEGVGAIHSPRRYLLDKILIEAAVEAGAEFREGFVTEDLLRDDGKVTGIRGRLTSGGTATERARIVVGADGKHSLVAKAVDAPRYDEHPALTCGYYSYWEGVPTIGGAIYRRGTRMLGAWPTNDNKTMIYVAWPAAEFDTFRADVERNYRATIDLAEDLAARVRQGRLAERILGTGDMPNFYRKPYGPGWALVGDAGFTKDAITGMGISDAFRDAELLAEAIDSGLAGRRPLEAALAEYEQKRNVASKAAYDFTLDIARNAPPSAMQIELFRALARNPETTSQFFGVLTGLMKPTEFFTPQLLLRVLQVRGIMKIALSRIFPVPQKQAS